MLLESNHINILLSFVRSISKSNDPDQLLSLNKVYENIFSNKLIYFLCIKQRSSLLFNYLLKQIRDRTESRQNLLIDQRLENLIISLAYLAVELDNKCKVEKKFRLNFYLIFFILLKIRADILKVLIDFYQKIPTATYYKLASFNYKHSKKRINSINLIRLFLF